VKAAHSLLLIVVSAAAYVIPAACQASPMIDLSDVRIASSFVAAGEPVPSECLEEAHIFAMSLVRYPRPDTWHWVLICDEAGWRRFLRLSGRSEGAAIYASTDLGGRTTYIRGAKLLYPYDLHVSPDGIVAHELAHILLRTESEARVNDLVRAWQGEGETGITIGLHQGWRWAPH